MRPGAQEAIARFIEEDVMLHDFSVLGLGVDRFMLVLVTALLVGFGAVCRFRPGTMRTKAQTAAEAYIAFIRDAMVYPNFGAEDGRAFVPFFCSLFLFIAFANLMGLVPGFAAVTGSISTTAALALVYAVGTLVFGFAAKGVRHTLLAFIPPGLPAPLRPFLFLLEFLGHVARTFALAVRLFANMLAGHIIIFWILGLVVMMGWAAFPAVLLASGLYAFEIFVCFLQAYIFTLLSSIFMGQIIHPQH